MGFDLHSYILLWLLLKIRVKFKIMHLSTTITLLIKRDWQWLSTPSNWTYTMTLGILGKWHYCRSSTWQRLSIRSIMIIFFFRDWMGCIKWEVMHINGFQSTYQLDHKRSILMAWIHLNNYSNTKYRKVWYLGCFSSSFVM